MFGIVATELHVRNDNGESTAPDRFTPVQQACSKDAKLGTSLGEIRSACIPMVRSQSVDQALTDWTAWQPTGRSDALWKRRLINTLPPFLTFSVETAQGIADWDDSINLS